MKDQIEELLELAKKSNAKVEWISTETDEGLQFYNMGGIGAILRWPVFSE